MINIKIVSAIVFAGASLSLVGCTNYNSDITGRQHAVKLSLQTPRFTQIKYLDAPIDLVVSDNRNYKNIGQINDPVFEQITSIYTYNNLDVTIQKQMVAMLVAQGHKVTVRKSPVEGHPTVEIMLKQLYAKGLQDNSMHAKAVVEVKAFSANNKHVFEKNFIVNAGYPSKAKTQVNKNDIKLAVEKVLNLVDKQIAKNPSFSLFNHLYFERKHPSL